MASSRVWFPLPNRLLFSVRKLPDWLGREMVDKVLNVNWDPILGAGEPDYVAMKTGPYTSKTVRRLMRHFPNPLGSIRYYEATVKIGDDRIGFLYLFSAKRKNTAEKLVQTLMFNLNALDKAMFITYRGDAYSAVDPEGRFLKAAIATRIPPSVLCLLVDPQLKFNCPCLAPLH